MELIKIIGILLAAYLLGSIPSGLIIVWLTTSKDVRLEGSGRTGGTNVMRTAGFWAGLATVIFDILKSAAATWLARWLLPDLTWAHILAPLLAVVGHNYSIFLARRGQAGELQLSGGAGGTPALGGAFGLWAPSLLILLPVGALILFGIGYASVATMSMGVMIVVLFAIRAALGLSSWFFVLYGVLVELLLLIALRPNIQRLRNGTERLIGWRSKRNQPKV